MLSDRAEYLLDMEHEEIKRLQTEIDRLREENEAYSIRHGCGSKESRTPLGVGITLEVSG